MVDIDLPLFPHYKHTQTHAHRLIEVSRFKTKQTEKCCWNEKSLLTEMKNVAPRRGVRIGDGNHGSNIRAGQLFICWLKQSDWEQALVSCNLAPLS